MASSTVTNAKYLDYAGLSTLVSNIKTLVNNKIDDTKQVLGGRLGKALTATEVQIGLHTPSGFTVNDSDVTELSSISIPGATTTAAGVMTSEDKKKLNNIAAGAEQNQKAFSNVKVGNTTISATSKTDTLTINATNSISITASTNKTLAIGWTHPTFSITTSTGSSTLTSGSKFTAVTGVGYNESGHVNNISSKEFTLPTLLNNIKFVEKTASVPAANTVNVLAGFISATNFAGKSTATIQYNTIQVPTQKYVDSQIADKIATADALIYKGTKTPDSNGKIYLEKDAKRGYLYKAAAAGYVYVTGTTTQGQHVEAGDMIIANTNSPTSLADWDILERNIDGAVSGPAQATTNNIAVFDGTTGKLIKDGGKKISDLATSGHVHNISLTASGDSEITVKKNDTGTLAVSFTVSHNAKLGTEFTGNATGATADSWSGRLAIKVPKLNINTYGHVIGAEEVTYNITIPAKPTHKSLDLTTYWGDGADSHAAYDPDTDYQSWNIYKGVKSVTGGSNITVTSTNGEVVVANTYSYTLPAATKNALGGVKIYNKRTTDVNTPSYGATTANRYYGVELDNSNRAFVHVPWTDTNDKVQSTLISTPTQNHYLLSSQIADNETAYTVKRNNVYITTDHVLACAPSTVQSTTASKVVTHSDAITTDMINVLFAQ